MADISKTAASVRPLNGAMIRRGEAGGSGSIGDLVYLDGTNGWKQADANASQDAAQGRGIVVAQGSDGDTTFADGDEIDIVVLGPVGGFSGMTPGDAVYNSATAGAVADAAPAETGDDWDFIVGWAESATVLFVHPQTAVPSAT